MDSLNLSMPFNVLKSRSVQAFFLHQGASKLYLSLSTLSALPSKNKVADGKEAGPNRQI
jgi:hypothetical protein